MPETLMPALLELEEAYRRIHRTGEFRRELAWYLKDYVGRPTPLYFARHLSAELGGPQIYLKREDLAHTGAHKINNTLVQGLLARRMGKTRASNPCPRVLLILCAPVWQRSSRLSRMVAEQRSLSRAAWYSGVGRPA